MNQNSTDSTVKYSFTLAMLMALTFMLPSVRGTLADTSPVTVSNNNAAAAALAVSVATTPVTSTAYTTTKTSNNKPIKCPPGYTCTPNPAPANDITARVTGNPKLALTYDSNHKEALLTATFDVTVDGGTTGTYISQYPYSYFQDSNGGYAYGNGMTSMVSPKTKADLVVGVYGNTFYHVSPKQKVQFTVVMTIDPKVLFAGSYSAVLGGLIGYPTTDYSQAGYVINVNSMTNRVTIVGETSSYIGSINPNQAYVGQQVTLTGQRLNLGGVYIDGSVFPPSNTSTNVAVDGTSLTFTVPALSTGWHIITVNSPEGMSNGVGLEVISTSTCPSGYTCTSPISVTNESVSYSTKNVSQTGSTTQQFTASFTVTANQDPVFLSKDISTALSFSYASKGSMDIQPVNIVDNNTSGDSSNYFYVSPGQSKTFSVTFSVTGMSTDVGSFSINTINYGTSESALAAMGYGDTTLQSMLTATLFH